MELTGALAWTRERIMAADPEALADWRTMRDRSAGRSERCPADPARTMPASRGTCPAGSKSGSGGGRHEKGIEAEQGGG